MSFIEESLYKDIIRSIPILCVDVIIKIDEKFLLLKRTQQPLKGEWWVPGGRVKLSETIEDAAKRKLKEELSVSLDEYSKINLVGIYEDFFDNSSYGNHRYHTVSHVYEIALENIEGLVLDKTHNNWALKNELPTRLLDNMRKIYA